MNISNAHNFRATSLQFLGAHKLIKNVHYNEDN